MGVSELNVLSRQGFPSSTSDRASLSARLRVVVVGLLWVGILAVSSQGFSSEDPSDTTSVSPLSLGKTRIEEGRFEEAVAILETVIEGDSGNPEALFLLGQANQSLGYYSESEEALRKLVELNPDHAEGWLWLGYTRYYHGESNRLDTMRMSASFIISRYRDAVVAFKEAVARDRENVNAWLGLGLSYFWVPELEQAAVTYRQGIDACPKEQSGQLQYLLGNLHTYYLPEYEKAVVALRAASELMPDRVDVLFDLGEAYLALEQVEEALAQWIALLKLAPGSQLVYDRIWRLYGHEKLYENAQSFLARAVEAGVRDPKISWYQGYYLLEGKRYEEAIVAFQAAIRQNPEFDTAYVLMARAHTESGDGVAAVDALKKALELNPNNADAKAQWIALARKRGGDGDFESALALFAEIVDRFPEQGELRADLALTLANLNRIDDAIREYGKAIEIDPFDTRIVNDLALVYEGMRDFSKAIDLYQQAEETAQDLDAMENLGVLHLKFGDVAKGQRQFAKVLRIDPNRERSLYLFHKCLRTVPRRQREIIKQSRMTGN